MRALINGRAIELSPLEFRLLRYLAHNRNRVVPQSELVEHVYGTDEPDSNAVEALVARLRRKIGPGIIETRRGHGYLVEDGSP
jgi:DNA-binding response OmpR family regulator